MYVESRFVLRNQIKRLKEKIKPCLVGQITLTVNFNENMKTLDFKITMFPDYVFNVIHCYGFLKTLIS